MPESIEMRLARQKVQIIIMRDALRRLRSRAAEYQSANAVLREQVRQLSSNTSAEYVRKLETAVRVFRSAIRGDDGEYIGGRRQRRALADADDFALSVLSAR